MFVLTSFFSARKHFLLGFLFTDYARSVFIADSLLVSMSSLNPSLLFRNAFLFVFLTCHYVLRLVFFLFTIIVFLAYFVVTTRHTPVVLLWLQAPCQCCGTVMICCWLRFRFRLQQFRMQTIFSTVFQQQRISTKSCPFSDRSSIISQKVGLSFLFFITFYVESGSKSGSGT